MLLQHRFVSMCGEYQRSKLGMTRQQYRCDMLEKSLQKWGTKFAYSQKTIEKLETEMMIAKVRY